MKDVSLSSSHSLAVSLQAIATQKANLSTKRIQMLNRTPEPGDWANFPANSIEIKDLAFLSAYTGHEYALMRGKKHDILFHGTHYKCNFDDELYDLLVSGKLRLIAHSHPDEEQIIPSNDDRDFLRTIRQESSVIISWKTGRVASFTSNRFDI